MQKTPQNMMPPRGRQQNQNTGRPQTQPGSQENGQSIPASPALVMARRIRNEQGQERARQYLMAMEPFLAPAERAHIAEQLGVTLPVRPAQQQAAPGQNTPPFAGQPFGSSGGMPFMGKGGMNNPLQMMQMFSGMNGMGKKGGAQSGGGMGDPMMLAQMFGSLMGKK